jgi:ribosomal protein S18 acetylase RimI-like enzyme
MLIDDLIIKQITNKKEILKILHEFDNIFSSPISKKVESLSNYANKLFENAFVYVARTDKNLGFVTLYANDINSNIAYISYIGVKKEARNMDIGKKLLETCKNKATEQGMKYLKLEVQKDNWIARKFYKKNGFSILGEASSKSLYMIKEL